MIRSTDEASDALIFFGATGDLAYKQIFPALYRLVRDEGLATPIIGVAKRGWNLDQLKGRAADSVKEHGGDINCDAFKQLLSQLRYVDGDYNDPNVFAELRKKMGDARQVGMLQECPAGCRETIWPRPEIGG
jgi:glucose-6-phosphate 1-dehydrogenase